MSGAGGGIAGTTDGSFFRCPGWVDLKKLPGESKQVPPTWSSWLAGVLKCGHVLYSPNLVWLSIAAAMWVVFPYDLEAAAEWRSDWMLRRLAINVGMTFGYVGFWHVSLYVLGWSERKFMPGVRPDVWRMTHNLWYSLLAVAQWTAWEVVFMRAYATGRLPYLADPFGSVDDALRFAFWTVFIPLFRGCHFYFAHRLIHVKPLYKFVHSLHHRNVDIEPFAGLCMHPIEHLYYFSCVCPSLYFRMSPFHFFWNGVHLLLSPAASHSGWEDHMQSDQFHYIHHRKFECNYGSASFPLDHLFGTFRDSLYGKSLTYKGTASDVRPREEKPTTYPPIPPSPRGFYVYMAFTSALFLAAAHSAAAPPQPLATAKRLAALVAFGPVLGAVLLMKLVGDKSDLRWPFHREVAPKFGLHLAVGLLIGVLPVYHALLSIHADKAHLPYCQLWGC